jgi:hypothetical protein
LPDFDFFQGYRRKRAVWEASLTQDTYKVSEAAAAMKMGERKVRALLASGALYHENPGERGTVIPKEAIIRYMIGPPPLEKLSERKRW